MATCTDNRRLGIVGCGLRYSGNQQHCVARCSHSRHADGRCHTTFSNVGAADKHWTKAGHIPPWLVTGLMLAADGIWKRASTRTPPHWKDTHDERSDESAAAPR